MSATEKAADKLRIAEPNYRRRRADMLAASIMRELADFIAPAALDRAHHALAKMFAETDAEVITEADRLAAGLPQRNDNGLSPEEHRIIETQRQLALVALPQIHICAKCSGQVL